MANSDKNIVITPNIGSSSADPKIVFSGANASTGPQNITLQVYPTNSGTLSFEGSSGQLFSISNTMSGTVFSANDVSGIPSIEVLDTGLIKLAQYSGNVLVGTGTDNGTDKLQVNGTIIGTTVKGTTLTSTVATGTAPLTIGSTTMVNNLNAQYLSGLLVHSSTNNEANKVVRTDGSGYIQASYIHSAAGNEGNNSSPSRVWGTNGSDSYLRTYLTSALNVNSASSAGSVTGLTLTSSAAGINPNSVTQNQLGYNTSVSLFGQIDGGLYSSAYDSTWIHQIYGDFRTGQVMVRGKNSGTWQSWLNLPTFGKSLIFAR